MNLLIYLILLILSPDALPCNFPGSSDEVLKLPGLNLTPNFRHYSGYLNATNGRFFHYWFTESQSNPSKDPLFLWLNGGPGCSSIGGMLNEYVGPWHLSENGSHLLSHDYSWNQLANGLFIESPAGTGFSYHEQNNLKTDDDQTAEDHHIALMHFFEKFPRFKKNDFYIIGESYAGFYVPMLALKILNHNSSVINLKGLATGNGLTDYDTILNTYVEYAYSHGFIDFQLHSEAVENCCRCINATIICDFLKGQFLDHPEVLKLQNKVNSTKCTNISNKIRAEVSKNLINPWYINNNCRDDSYEDPYAPTNNTCLSYNRLLAQYLNQPQVRQSLHIPTFVQNWVICNNKVNTQYFTQYRNVKSQFNQILSHEKFQNNSIIFYSGDSDLVINHLGTQRFVESFNLPIVAKYVPWKYNGTNAGFVKRYSNNVSFVTIRDAGHMAPEDKPGPALMIFKDLINVLKLDSDIN